MNPSYFYVHQGYKVLTRPHMGIIWVSYGGEQCGTGVNLPTKNGDTLVAIGCFKQREPECRFVFGH